MGNNENKCRCSSGVERFLGKEEVMGSNPIIGSNESQGWSETYLLIVIKKCPNRLRHL